MVRSKLSEEVRLKISLPLDQIAIHHALVAARITLPEWQLAVKYWEA